MLDLGCGEGSLLSALCGPASSVPNDPQDSHLSSPVRDLSLERVAGLDIDPAVIDDAVNAATYDREPHYLAPWGSGEDGWYIRWAPLEVSVWQGQLEVPNPEFYGFDAIVSTEVYAISFVWLATSDHLAGRFEHVPDSVLPAFSHVLLGQYRPRLMLLTTPNFTFNARFHPPDVPRKGFLDPTGQTSRVFRHSDHKREWTVPEFEEWCLEAANTHGYEVKLDGVGVPVEPDPFGRELGYASQTALFVRRDSDPGSLGLERMNIASLFASTGPAHQLIAQKVFPADPRAGQPQPARAIRAALAELMNVRGEGELTFSELWCELAMPCGGSVAALVDALMEAPEGETPQDSSIYAAPEETDTSTSDDRVGEAGDTLGQWFILPPRNPNCYTEPRWDRVVVWQEFKDRPLQQEAGPDEFHETTEEDVEGEYASEEEYERSSHGLTWESSGGGWLEADGEADIPATPDPGLSGGWGKVPDDDSAGWGEVVQDDAAAAATWGYVEPDNKNNGISIWATGVEESTTED